MRKFKFLVSVVLVGSMVAACGDNRDNLDTSGNGVGQEADAGTVQPSAKPDPLAALPELSDALTFKNPRNCEWGAAAERIFESATSFGNDYVTRPGTVNVPGIEQPVTARLTRPYSDSPDYIETFLDFEGQWLGLKVVGLNQAGIEEGDLAGRSIRFDEPVQKVAEAMSSAGFDVNADGTVRDRTISSGEHENTVATTKIDLIDGVAVFSCNVWFDYK